MTFINNNNILKFLCFKVKNDSKNITYCLCIVYTSKSDLLKKLT